MPSWLGIRLMWEWLFPAGAVFWIRVTADRLVKPVQGGVLRAPSCTRALDV